MREDNQYIGTEMTVQVRSRSSKDVTERLRAAQFIKILKKKTKLFPKRICPYRKNLDRNDRLLQRRN